MMPPASSEPVDPALVVEQAEQRQQVKAALDRLSAREMRLLALRYSGFTYQELAEACHVSPNSVGQLLARAGRAFKLAYQL